MSNDNAYEDNFEEVVEVDQTDDDVDTAEDAAAPAGPYGVGPFTVREVSILGAWLVLFIISFFPAYATPLSLFSDDVRLPHEAARSVWTSGIDWVLLIGVPTAAVFLIVLRRFSPQGIRRVGSLGVDQFASVAFSVSAVLWLSVLWSSLTTVIALNVWTTTWVVWVALVLTLALVVLTVLAPFIPPFRDDFRGRPAEEAHRNARQVLPVVARPARERPAAPVADEPNPYAPVEGESGSYDSAGYGAAPFAAQGAAPATNETDVFAPFDTGTSGTSETGGYARSGSAGADTGTQEWAAPAAAAPAYARSTPEPEPVISHQPFWALVPVERDVIDEQTGAPLFRIGPTAWALVVADRGSSFLVRHDDGRVGVLYDVTGVTRG